MKKFPSEREIADADTVDFEDIEGSGKGGGSAPVELPNAVTKGQKFKTQFVISEGEIESLDDVLLNGISYTSFPTVLVGSRLGTASQTMMKMFNHTEAAATHSVVDMAYNNLTYIRSLYGTSDAAHIILTCNALFYIEPKRNNMIGATISHRIDVRPNAGAGWTTAHTDTRTLKSTVPFSFDFFIDAPTGTVDATPWQIRVVRLTPDDPDSKTNSKVSWTGLYDVQYVKLTYPNTALVGIAFTQSNAFGGQLPEIVFKVKGLKVRVPSNYTFSTRTYSGTWDLSFKLAKEYTDNPVWHLLEVLTNTRWGLGLADADIDTASFYTAAVYSDTIIAYTLDGVTKNEPRYTMHNQFIAREDVPTFLGHFLSIINGNFSTNALGQVSLVIDKAGLPVTKLVTKSNVIGGMFSYTSTDLESRFSQVNVTYNDPTARGRTNTAIVTDSALQTRYGLQILDIALVGCMSERQAIHKGRWALYTNGYQTDMVTWKVLFEGLVYRIGEVVKLMDDDNALVTQQARIATSTPGASTSITLDRSLTLAAGTYTISFQNADGITINEVSKTFTAGNYQTFSVTGNFTISAGAVILFSGPTQARLFRIINIKKEDDGAYAITGLAHYEAKFSYIEGSVDLTTDTGAFVNFNATSISAPTNLQFSYTVAADSSTHLNVIQITWSWTAGPNDGINPTFMVMWRRDGGNFTTTGELPVQFFEIENPEPGTYEVYVYAINPGSKLKSTALTGTYPFRIASGASTLSAPASAYVKGTSAYAYDTQDLVIEILYNTANDSSLDKIVDYVVEIWTSDGITKKATRTVKMDTAKNALFGLTYAENISLFGTATRNVQLRVYSRDSIGDLSPALSNVYTNAVPAAPTFSIIAGAENLYVKITPPAGNDIAGYIVYRSTTTGFTPGAGNQIYDGPDTYVPCTGSQNTTYYFRVAAYDTFGKTGLNLATEQNSTTLAYTPDTFTYTGLAFKPNDPATNRVSWTAGTASKNGATPVTINANSAGTLWSSGIMYVYYVPGNSTLQTTTTLATAIGAGGRILATYKGGTDLQVGDGKAFISGDQLLAGTVGAAALVTNTAVITGSAQIANLIVNNSHINDLSADKINAGLLSATYIDSRNLTIKDAAGNIIFSAGQNLDFARVGGATKPANNATVGATWNVNLGGVPANLSSLSGTEGILNSDLSDAIGGNFFRYSENCIEFPATWYPQLGTLSNAIAPDLTTTAYLFTSSGIGNTAVGYNDSVTSAINFAGQVVTFSVWLKAGTHPGNLRLRIRDSLSAEVAFLVVTPTSTWTRYSLTTSWPASGFGIGLICYIDTDSSSTAAGQTFSYAWPQFNLGVPTEYMKTYDKIVYRSKTSNSLISINRDGSLSGAGSGIVTLGGLGLGAAPQEFFEAWADPDSINDWVVVAGDGTQISIQSASDSSFGGKVLKIGDNLGNDEVRLMHKRLIPFDPNKTYRIQVRAKITNGTGLMYVGFTGVAADGTTYVNTTGANFNYTGQHYHGAYSQALTSSYQTFTGYTKGFGASVGTSVAGTISSPGQMHPNVRYIQPLIIGNYSGLAGITYFDAILVDDGAGQISLDGTTKYRTSGTPTNNPTPSGITITTNSNATINIRLDWSAYTQGVNQADLILIFWRKDGTAPTINDSSLAFNVNPSASYFVFEGVNPADTFSFGIAAARRTENGLEIGTIQTPTSAPDWLGVTSGTPNYTANIGGTAAATVATAITNFNGRNDRDGTAITVPTIAADGTAVDHTIASDGSANISFEWAWTGVNADIDGWIIYVYQSTTNTAYTFGTTPAAEQVFIATSDKRAFFLYGVPANQYYTFGIRAYRQVDPDISASRLIQTSIIKPSLAAENPYQPSTSVAFAGDVTGTVNGIAAANINVWQQISLRPQESGNRVTTSNFGTTNYYANSVGSWNAGSVQTGITGQDFTVALASSQRDLVDDVFPVKAGEVYFCEAMLNSSATTGTVNFGLGFINSSGSFFAWAFGCTLGAGQGWTATKGKVTVPTGAVGAAPWLQINLVSGFGTALMARPWISNHEQAATLGADFDSNLVNIPYATIYSVDSSTAMGFNPAFSDWTGSYPTNWLVWGGAAPTKETTLVRVGKYSVKYVAAASNLGMYCQATWTTTPAKNYYVTGNFDAYVSVYTSGGSPGILVRLYVDSGLVSYRDLWVPITDKTKTAVWQRVNFAHTVQTGESIYGIRVYVMACWTSATDGAFTGTVIFDNINFDMRPQATASTVQTFIADLAVNSLQVGNSLVSAPYVDITNANIVQAWTSGVTYYIASGGSAVSNSGKQIYLAAAVSISTLTLAIYSGSVYAATITTSTAHGLAVGDFFEISGITNSGTDAVVGGFNKVYKVYSVTNSTVFICHLQNEGAYLRSSVSGTGSIRKISGNKISVILSGEVFSYTTYTADAMISLYPMISFDNGTTFIPVDNEYNILASATTNENGFILFRSGQNISTNYISQFEILPTAMPFKLG